MERWLQSRDWFVAELEASIDVTPDAMTEARRIDWEQVHMLMPTRQDPTSRARRKALFKDLDRDKSSKSELDYNEVQEGIARLLRVDIKATSLVPSIKEIRTVVKLAFKVAKDLHIKRSPKTKPKSRPKPKQTAKKGTIQGTVDLKEFRAFLIAFKYYLEVAELFESMDQMESDNMLSLRECMKGVKELMEWGITREDLAEKFVGVEVWTPHMKLEDFSCWVVEMRCMNLQLDNSDDEEVIEAKAAEQLQGSTKAISTMGQESEINRVYVQDAFAQWDLDGDGSITEEEMAAVLQDLDPELTPERVKKLFKAADKNSDGVIDFEEMLAWLFQ
eukprot:TRINITY_DN76230_c0_g1_i1.p1 TRINITY_DN76230_c0_g1~~TRINITY_DN76230_c0_g1_i1.p1  ORF type:complete len:332 (+),score=77.70 TRINITY_DN76230_c0_g1_i1:83-1078(+)